MTEKFQAKTPQTPKNQLSTPDEAVSELIESYDESFNPFLKSRMTEWNTNIAYLLGKQHIELEDGHLVEAVDLSPFTVTANKLEPAVRGDIAKATKIPPVFDVVPDTNDENDRATSIVGQKVIQYLRRINDFNGQRAQLVLWYDIANIAWRKIVWNPSYKIIGYNPEPEMEGHNPQMEPGEPIFQGEVESDVIPNNELIYDFRLRPDKLPWIIHARPMTIADIAQKWSAEIAESVPDDELNQDNRNEFEIQLFGQFQENFKPATKPKSENLTRQQKEANVFELWQKPDKNFPLGIYAIKIGKSTIAVNIPYPIETYRHGQLPFIPYSPLLVHNIASGTASRISQARPLQRELNGIRTLIHENIAMLGAGIWKIPRGSKVNIDTLDNGIGLFLEYDGTYEPHREAGVGVSGSIFAHVEKIEGDIDEIFAFHEVSKGQHPKGGPRSGIGIAQLQEADITQMSPIINEFERKDEIAVNQMLSLALANYKQRTLDIIGKDNEWCLFEYDPESFNGNVNVHIRAGSSLPVSRAYERELALGLGSAGWLGNPTDPAVRRKVLETIDLGGLDKVLKDDSKDINFAKKEFAIPLMVYEQNKTTIDWENEEQLAQLLFLPNVNSFDRHDIHYVEHRNDLTDKYHDIIASGDPGLIIIAQAMVAHLTQHSEILQAQQLQQAVLSGQIKPTESKEQ